MPWIALTHPPDTLGILALALLLEAVAGYPDRLYRALGHPVTWIGRLIGALDAALNRGSFARRRAGGVLAVLILLAVVGAAALGLTALAGLAGPYAGLALLALLGASLPAQRSLHDHVTRVAAALRAEGLAGGRRAVSMIVGRDPDTLDEAAICRAAIESLAENFSDGIVAPAFWIGIGGLPGGALYKAVNTADSMIGHRTPRHEAFGWAAARLDDLVNLPASRLTAGLIVAAAALHGLNALPPPSAGEGRPRRGAGEGAPASERGGADMQAAAPSCAVAPLPRRGEREAEPSARNALAAIRRDARKHRSPNAGWPEAAMAGALGLALAGPRVYGGSRVADAWMGDGRQAAGPADIERALALYRTACALLWGLAAGAAAIGFLI